MNDEEKKAVEFLEKLKDLNVVFCSYAFNNEKVFLSEEEKEQINKIINIIKKQSKEIEELNRENTRQHELIGNIHQKWEDKLKAKIEKLDDEIEVKREIAKNPMDRVSGRLLTDSIVELEKTKKVLQSLLEKE